MGSVSRVIPAADASVARRLAAYWELTKPRVAALVVAVTAAGYWMGAAGNPDSTRLSSTILGVWLLAAGIFALNQYFEADTDGMMQRTWARPLPSGRIEGSHAMWFGWALTFAGVACLALAVNWLSAAVGIATMAGYLFLYTPLKKRTPLCTLVGAFPGAVPPLLGWAAARNELSLEAWWLFGLMFLWQFPHFHSIAMLYREDYARAGFRLYTVVEPDDRCISRQILGYSVVLLPVSVLPALVGRAGLVYGAGATLLGVAFLYLAALTARGRTRGDAQRLLLGSVIYLPGLLLLMVLGA